MKLIFSIWLVLLSVTCILAQSDTIIALDEVIMTDVKLRQFSDGVKTTVLNDSVALRNQGTFTDNLRNNSTLYFKEYGYGMTSTVSFRGTGASQTAVVWNGININSPMSGQTDFNTLLSQSTNEVTIRSGGGSTQYGTGAIGGSVHINSILEFGNHSDQRLSMGYGAFDTRSLFYAGSFGKRQNALKIGVGHYASENDFKYLDTDRRNENGAFDNTSLDLAYGITLGKSHILKVYNQTFVGDRNFSGTLTAPSNDNYHDLNSRSLAEWVNFGPQKVQRVKAAYLYERYRYYPNRLQDDFSFGNANTFLFNYDYKYHFKKFVINGISEFQTITADGSSILPENRTLFSGILLLSHAPTDRLRYGLNLRKDWISSYESPFVFSLNSRYALTDNYQVSILGSKNFRAPTFNDLYWEGAGATGNTNLAPETALQGEVGQRLTLKNLHFQLNGYYIASKDLIQWRPDLSGVWSPVNVKDATQYGFELESGWKKNKGVHQVSLNAAYAFSKSIDTSTEKQLLYVPLHTVRGNISYAYGRWRTYLQALYNGQVYTTTDNEQDIPGYVVGNWGLEYELPTILGIVATTAIKVNNVSNTRYQNVAFRPMPNRHFHFQLNFKF